MGGSLLLMGATRIYFLGVSHVHQSHGSQDMLACRTGSHYEDA